MYAVCICIQVDGGVAGKALREGAKAIASILLQMSCHTFEAVELTVVDLVLYLESSGRQPFQESLPR